MPDTSGLGPRELAAFDQFQAKFRDMQQEFCASLQAASDTFAAMGDALRDLGDVMRAEVAQTAIAAGEVVRGHPELIALGLRPDEHLDGAGD